MRLLGMTKRLVPNGNRSPSYKTVSGIKIGMSCLFVGSLRDAMGNIPTSPERCSYPYISPGVIGLKKAYIYFPAQFLVHVQYQLRVMYFFFSCRVKC